MRRYNHLFLAFISSIILSVAGCPDFSKGDIKDQVEITPNPEKSLSLTGVAAYEKMIEDLQKHPKIIERINKNREEPITRQELITHYRNRIRELQSRKKSPDSATSSIGTCPTKESYILINQVDKRFVDFTTRTKCNNTEGIKHYQDYRIEVSSTGTLVDKKQYISTTEHLVHQYPQNSRTVTGAVPALSTYFHSRNIFEWQLPFHCNPRRLVERRLILSSNEPES